MDNSIGVFDSERKIFNSVYAALARDAAVDNMAKINQVLLPSEAALEAARKEQNAKIEGVANTVLEQAKNSWRFSRLFRLFSWLTGFDSKVKLAAKTAYKLLKNLVRENATYLEGSEERERFDLTKKLPKEKTPYQVLIEKQMLHQGYRKTIKDHEQATRATRLAKSTLDESYVIDQFRSILQDPQIEEDLPQVNQTLNEELADLQGIEDRVQRDLGSRSGSVPLKIGGEETSYETLRTNYQDQTDLFPLLQILACAEYEMVPSGKFDEAWMKKISIESPFKVLCRVAEKEITLSPGTVDITYHMNFSLREVKGGVRTIETHRVEVSYRYSQENAGQWRRSETTWKHAGSVPVELSAQEKHEQGRGDEERDATGIRPGEAERVKTLREEGASEEADIIFAPKLTTPPTYSGQIAISVG